MTTFLQSHYDTEGPFGIPMKDDQARTIDAIVKNLPRDDAHEPLWIPLPKAVAETNQPGRYDVSWITADGIDREREVVIPRGMNDEAYKLNPIVTMNHAYWLPPVGKSLWRKYVKEREVRGIKAKTTYPVRPETWKSAEDWPPDVAFAMIQSGLLMGKSVGILPVKSRAPTSEEVARTASLARVQRIIEEWVLIEYACTYLPVHPQAVVDEVAKSLHIPDACARALGIQPPAREAVVQPIPFTALSEIEKAVRRQIDTLYIPALIDDVLQQRMGRI